MLLSTTPRRVYQVYKYMKLLYIKSDVGPARSVLFIHIDDGSPEGVSTMVFHTTFHQRTFFSLEILGAELGTVPELGL